MKTEHELATNGLRILQNYGVPLERAEDQPAKPGKPPYGPDATFTLNIGDERQPVDVECKKGFRPGDAGLIAAQPCYGDHLRLLVTDYVSRPMAERLRDLGIAFVDMAGNAWLQKPPVVIHVEGRKPVGEPVPAPRNRAFHAAGLRVIFALLCRPERFRAPLREIAEAAGVGHATVGWVMQGLKEAGYVIERGKGRGRKRYPRNLPRLLEEWAAAYTRTLRPTLLLGRYAPGAKTAPDWWRKVDPVATDLLLGAEPAAAQLTDYLQPGTITFYGEGVPGRVIAENRLVRDEAGTIEFRHRFWRFHENDGDEGLTPPVLVYADLLATDNARCIETARMIHERYLAGPLGQT